MPWLWAVPFPLQQASRDPVLLAAFRVTGVSLADLEKNASECFNRKLIPLP